MVTLLGIYFARNILWFIKQCFIDEGFHCDIAFSAFVELMKYFNCVYLNDDYLMLSKIFSGSSCIVWIGCREQS